jgi:hypothetical protein
MTPAKLYIKKVDANFPIGVFAFFAYIITPATNSRKSRRSFRQSALLAESLHTTGMRGSAASHTDENLRRFVPIINCRGNKKSKRARHKRHDHLLHNTGTVWLNLLLYGGMSPPPPLFLGEYHGLHHFSVSAPSLTLPLSTSKRDAQSIRFVPIPYQMI